MSHHESEDEQTIRGWFTGRIPEGWFTGQPSFTFDRDEVVIVGDLPDVTLPDDAPPAERAAARASKTDAFREDTRDQRIRIAVDAEHRFGRKVSWGVRLGDETRPFTTLSMPVMTRLRQRERVVLDTLVDAGVARSRSEALAWCVRLVGENQGEWIAKLKGALESVQAVRSEGPSPSGSTKRVN
jgi:hypothetical protein